MASTIHSNRNGSSRLDLRPQPRRAKWRLANSDRIPPVAFGIPAEEIDPRAIMAASKGQDREKQIRQYVEAQLLSRYGMIVETLRARVRSIDLNLERFRNDFVRVKKEREKLEIQEIETRPGIRSPSWKVSVCATVMVLLFIALVTSEWLNIAGFAARGEMQSLGYALAFTFVIAAVPIALKIAKRSIAIPIIIAAFGFIWWYARCYLQESQGAEALVAQLLDVSRVAPTVSEGAARSWLLIFQVATSVLVGYAFASGFAMLVVSSPHYKINPDLEVFDRELDRLQKRILEESEKRDPSAGDLVEFENSCRVYMAQFLGIATKLDQLEAARRQFSSNLQREVNELSSEVSGLLPNNH